MTLRDLAANATPGPWYWSSEYLLDTRADAPYVAHFVDHWNCDTPDEADARLIALAPDLATLCADMADALAYVDDWRDRVGIESPEALLARFRDLETRAGAE